MAENEQVALSRQEKYVKERLDDQIMWYSKKSSANKRNHFAVATLIIMFSALIPFLTGLENEIISEKVVGFLGICIAIATGVASLYKYQENWINYRKTCEELKREKNWYDSQIAPYDEEATRFKILVTRTEHILDKELKEWDTNMNKK